MKSDLNDLLARGRDAVEAVRARVGLDADGLQGGEPPTDEVWLKYVEALEAEVRGAAIAARVYLLGSADD